MNHRKIRTNKDDWRTPKWLFDRLNKVYDFELDAACDTKNKLCPVTFTSEFSALRKEAAWAFRTFCNPPFSKKVEFIKKAIEQVEGGGMSCLRNGFAIGVRCKLVS